VQWNEVTKEIVYRACVTFCLQSYALFELNFDSPFKNEAMETCYEYYVLLLVTAM